MAWSDTALSGGTYGTRVEFQSVCLGQREVDYSSSAGSFPQYRVQGTAFVFAKVRTKVTTYVGLTETGANTIATANTTSGTWKTACTKLGVVVVGFPYEQYSKTAQARRVDASGQWAVDVTETKVVLDSPAYNSDGSKDDFNT